LQAFTRAGWRPVIVTNQSGIARGYFTEADLEAVHRHLIDLLQAMGVSLAGIHHCPHGPDSDCRCRKPAPGLAERAAAELGADLTQAVMIGDKPADLELARAIGAFAVLTRQGYGRQTELDAPGLADLVVDDLDEAARRLLGPDSPLSTRDRFAS
jgi:D-glycero-D-manno-heptose 1,7-bisphosphate phosphatase